MRMTVQTDYALRVLMHLAIEEERVTIDMIADAYAISRHHVMKVTQKLAALGYLNNKRGRAGGLMLAREAAEINVGDLVRRFEETGQFVECFDPATNHCAVTPVCGLKHVLADAVEQFLTHLDQFTIADLIRKPVDFRTLLHEHAETR